MSVSIWIVRHGEASATWGEHADPGLSELGAAQARAAATWLGQRVPEGVQLISSPKCRAQQTAQPLARLLNASVRIDNAFNEITAPVPLPERQSWLQSYMRQMWSEQSEDILAWRRGMIAALHAIDVPTVIFSHFLVINTVVAHIRNAPQTLQFWPDNGSCHQFEKTPNGELTLVELGRELSTHVN